MIVNVEQPKRYTQTDLFLYDITERLRAEPDRVLLKWYGILYNDDDVFARLDRAFLMMLYLQDGEPFLRRMIGFKDKNAQGLPAVYFPRDIPYTVLSGKRKGRVLPLSRITDDEDRRPAGIYKRLVCGKEPDRLDTSSRNDTILLENMDGCLFAQPAAPDEAVPAFYLCCRPDSTELYLRPGSPLERAVAETPGFPRSRMPSSVFIETRADWCRDAGQGRVAYPFESVHGRGVVCVDTASFGVWRSVGVKDGLLAGSSPYDAVVVEVPS